jgi:ligand-binding sensor domain-containing protein/signal transduction histidine kinase
MESRFNGWNWRSTWILVGCFLLLTNRSSGAPAKTAASEKFQYTRTVWHVADGLPEDTAQALAESPDGRLWIGTTGGLARFDGAGIELYGIGGSKPLEASSIFCLAVAHDGSLWAGTEGGGLVRFKGGETRVYSAHDGLTDGFVRSVYEDHRARLWVGTDDGLFVLEGNHLRRVDGGPAFPPLAVHSITEDNEHRLWVGGSRLIAINPDGSRREFTLPGAYSQNRVKRILQTVDGIVWVGTVGGLQYFKSNRFYPVNQIHATVRSLLQTTDGTLWIGTIGDGLWTLRDSRLSQLSIPGLLPSETVLSVFQDNQQQVWIGTQAGLLRLNKTPVDVIALPESGDPDFETISGDDRGNIWVAAQRLYLIHNGVAAPVTYENLANVPVRNVYRARDGALWIGTDGSGAYRISDTAVKHYTAPAQLTNNFIRGFLEGRDGTMWIATDEGLSRIGREGARKLTEADGLAFFSTRSLMEARDRSLWVGTDHGLSHWKGDRFEQDEVTRGLREEKIWSILEDRQGALWFGTRNHGLYRWSHGRLDQFTSVEGLPSNSVYQILQDRTGTFWLTGPNTIASIPEAEMEQSQPSPDRPLSVKEYSMPFGAEDAQLYGGRQPSGYLAPDDSVWFPTNHGVAHILHADHERQPAPNVLIESVIEDGRRVVPHGRLDVPAHVVRLSLPFTAISLWSQDAVRFRYKLESFDHTWNVLTSASAAERVATYTNLRAGHYRFRVQAFNTANPGIVSEADLAFTKSPFFYETWWFYLLCGLVLAVIAWSLYQIRVRRIRTRFEVVLAERTRLAREMHDTVIQGCTGISALLEAVASTPVDQQSAKDDLLDYARTQARTTIQEAREAIWNMRHEGEKDIELVEALNSVATQTMREFGTVVDVEHNLSRVPVAASIAHEILMTVREAVYNSVQHGRTQTVTISVQDNEDDLSIAIVDAGCGFIVNGTDGADEGHYGIVGMQERMQRLGGWLELTSAPGAGTTVRLRVQRRESGRRQGS